MKPKQPPHPLLRRGPVFQQLYATCAVFCALFASRTASAQPVGGLEQTASTVERAMSTPAQVGPPSGKPAATPYPPTRYALDLKKLETQKRVGIALVCVGAFAFVPCAVVTGFFFYLNGLWPSSGPGLPLSLLSTVLTAFVTTVGALLIASARREKRKVQKRFWNERFGPSGPAAPVAFQSPP